MLIAHGIICFVVVGDGGDGGDAGDAVFGLFPAFALHFCYSQFLFSQTISDKTFCQQNLQIALFANKIYK